MMKAYLCCDPSSCGFAEAIETEVAMKCDEFLGTIGKIREYLETDVQAAYDGDPAAYSMEEIIYSYPGIYAITVYRIAHELFVMGVPLIPRIMTEHAHGLTGIDIHPGATIDKYFFIDHGTGIVIGETTTIGHHVKIYQGVTLGGLSTKGGQAIKGKKRHPDIQDYVTIFFRRFDSGRRDGHRRRFHYRRQRFCNFVRTSEHYGSDEKSGVSL